MFSPKACYDVAVFGGGLCGFAAARELARRGHSVALIERRPVLGWEIAWALHARGSLSSSNRTEWFLEAIAAATGAGMPCLDPPIAEMVLDREARAAGLAVLLYAQPVAVALQEGKAATVVVGTKSGELPVRAKCFLDATEEAILWRLAGSRIVPSEPIPGVHTVVLNRVPEGAAKAPIDLGALAGCRNVSVRPTMWPGEVAIDLVLDTCDIRAARLILPAALQAVREKTDALANALVTSVGNALYPLEAIRVEDADGMVHPDARNLFGAGPWALSPFGYAGEVTIAERLSRGVNAAEAITMAHRHLLAGAASHAPVPHSQVAPPVHEADVVVCGGGTGGALAAIAAARQGAHTILIEQSTCLGGIGTGGGIHSYYHGVAGGLQDELDKRVANLAPLFGPAAGFHPEAKKVALEQLAHEAGVKVVYDTTITGAQTDSVPSRLPASKRDTVELVRRLRAVVAAGLEGNALYRAQVFVDATGDGDLAAMAGARFTLGRATDSLPHAYSLAAGRLSDDGKLLITNFDAGYCDPTDAVDLTRARRHALGHYWRERFDARTRLLYIAPILGLRNSRQIVGDACITMADQIAGRQFPDVIAYAYSHYDNHGCDYENESDEAMLWVWLLGNWQRRIGCEIPYRALLPAGIEGLLMACRALSMTHDAHNQLRMQRDLQRIGEAAGIAAALAARRGITPRALPIADLQAELLKTGALGSRQLPRLPMPSATEAALHDSSWMPPQVPALPLAERIAQLSTEKTSEACWDLIRRGADALPLLLEAARAPVPTTRFWASVALAMLRRPEAAPELRAALAERRADVPEGRKAVPLWKSATVLLGRIADRQAVPELCKVLENPQSDLDARIAAVRALGRIGDPAAVPALNALADRRDVPAERILQVSSPGGCPVSEDARWQLDLAIAEALAALGAPRPDLTARHAADERAYVRRYARQVAQPASPAAGS